MRIIKYLLGALLFGDAFNKDQYTVLKDFYNTHFFGRPLRTMLKQGDRVLELGCGKDSLLIRSGLIKKLRVTGVDVFKPYVDMHNSDGLYEQCILADITRIEFPPDRFDAVICMDVLEHVAKDEGIKLLDKMKVWGRKVIITTPNGAVPGIPSDGNIHQGHQSGWTARELEVHGYTIRGASGWKVLRKPDSQLRHLHPFVFWAGLSLLSTLAVYFIPSRAFHLQATYEKRCEKQRNSMKNKHATILATKMYRLFSPYILALISVPVYFLKYRKYRLVKQTEAGFANHIKQQLGAPDETIARLLNAYHKAKTDQRQASSPYQVGHLWQEILDTRFGKLTTALLEHDSSTVKSLLENFNREDCGNDTCGGGQYHQRMQTIPFYKYQYINAWQQRYNVCKRELGKEPIFDSKLIGNPVGICQQEHVVPLGNIEYYYYANRIVPLLGQTNRPVICEIGGGVGGQAYETIRCNIPDLSYIILDIPEVLLLSSYYLMMAFPDKKIHLYGENENVANCDIALLPNFSLPALVNNSVDLFFNSCSFSEMNYSTTKEYLRQIERVCRRYLMHINHNAHLIWYEKGNRIANMTADEVVPDASLFRRVYRKPRLFSLLEDAFVIHWFYHAKYYQYLYERRCYDKTG